MQEEEQSQEMKLPVVVEWFFKKKKQVVYSVVLAFFLGFLIYEYSPFFKQKELAMDKTHKAYVEWMNHSDDLALADDLRLNIAKNPTMKPKYQGVLLQHLLDQDQDQEVREEALEALGRTGSLTSYYGEFAKVTISINEKQYDKALDETLQLKEVLSKGHADSLLMAHNLLRVASLYKVMGVKGKELSAWQDVETLLSNWQKDSETKHLYEKFSRSFSNKEAVAFEEYIADRKKAL